MSRVLIIRPGALGDTILSLPAIRALRRWAGREARIELVGYPRVLGLALNRLHADHMYSVDRAIFAGLFSEPATTELERFLESFDTVIAWCRDPSGSLTRLLERLGVAFLRADPFPPLDSGVHATDHLLATLAPLGVAGPLAPPQIVVSEEAVRLGEDFLRERNLADRPFLGLHPGSGSPRKNWGPEGFSDLAHRARKAGLELLLVEGEADRDPAQRVLERLEWTPAVARDLDLPILAAILSRASAYAGNDSGVSHLAAAAGTPTLAFFGPTDPRTWAPKGRLARALPHDVEIQVAWCVLENLIPMR